MWCLPGGGRATGEDLQSINLDGEPVWIMINISMNNNGNVKAANNCECIVRKCSLDAITEMLSGVSGHWGEVFP